jgi:TolB protein
MTRANRFGSLLSVLPVAGLVAAALPAVPVLPAGPAVHRGLASGPAATAAEARYPTRASSISAAGDVVTFAENVGTGWGSTPLYVVFARDLVHAATQRISRGIQQDAARRAPGNGVAPDSVVSADGRYVAFSQWVDVPRFQVLLYDLSTHASRQVSLGHAGAGPDGPSFNPAISADGSYVAFESAATNLVSGDTNDASDVFRSDGSTIRRVSVGGGGQADSGSHGPVISANGRYVAFTSDATNLVPGDTNDLPDVFVRDLRYGTTRRLSVATGGRQADGASFRLALSADGRYVAFESAATNLVPGDTNDRTDVFVRDLRYGTTNRVSLGSGRVQANGYYSAGPSLSADGRYVAFTSDATNLVPGDTNGRPDVFVRDLRYGLTYRVSLGADGSQADGYSTAASISADGRFVSFTSIASNLVPDDTNGVEDGFVRDRWTRTTVRTTLDTDPS